MIVAHSPKISLTCAIAGAFFLAACAPSPAVQEYASENAISLRYSAWDSVPTLTAEAQDKATKHCAKFGKFANYKGGNAVSPLTAEEIHTFACEDVKTDDSLIIARQSERPDTYVYQTQVNRPTQTNCTVFGNTANCTSY
ncbi:hypothetical protein [Ruegeria atlantica]|uniref:hypothetical protein n=1 Tax=Ruegeria atlantica TaxID=81569 RepID=UPI0014807B0E|nr:hypothetical protein [Ruegeria atlantica]